jgi:hypothetical protein
MSASTIPIPNALSSLSSLNPISIAPYSSLLQHIQSLTELLQVNIDNTNRKLRAHLFNLRTNVPTVNRLPKSLKKLFLPIQYEFKQIDNSEFHFITKLIPKQVISPPAYTIKILSPIKEIIKNKNKPFTTELPPPLKEAQRIIEQSPVLSQVFNKTIKEAKDEHEADPSFQVEISQQDLKVADQYVLPGLTKLIDEHNKNRLTFSSNKMKKYFQPFERKVFPYLKKRYDSLKSDKDGNKLVSMSAKIFTLNGWSHLPNKLDEVINEYFKYKVTGISPNSQSTALYDND